MKTSGASEPYDSISARSASTLKSARIPERTIAATTATKTSTARTGRARSTSAPRRREVQPEPGVPLDQLDQVREVLLAHPRADGRDERLRHLRRRRGRHPALPRDVEEEPGVLGREPSANWSAGPLVQGSTMRSM
jgi:hypothetical protein